MKTIEAYNEERLAIIAARKKAMESPLTGIECPQCKTEMHFVNKSMMLLSSPPQYAVYCPSCKHHDYIYA